MRLTSLLFLALIVGAIGAVAFVPKIRNMVFKTVNEGRKWAEGYGPAKEPMQAMDHFKTAIKARDYETAADYVTESYAAQLRRAHEAARTIGNTLDSITKWGKNAGTINETSRYAIHHLDPFPTNFKILGEPKKSGDDKGTGAFAEEPIGEMKPIGPNTLKGLDMRMFNQCLAPATLFKGVQLVKEGKGDDATWKLDFPVANEQVQAISYFVENYKGYQTGLHNFDNELNNNRYPSKTDFEHELLQVLVKAAK